MLTVNISHRFSTAPDSFCLTANFSTDSKKLALFGPSGSGKTLTLQAVAGLFSAQKGSIALDGQELFCSQKKICVPARDREIGYLFQDYALFPHLTVWQNVAFPLIKPFASRALKRFATEKVNNLLERFELTHVANQHPAKISGGQKQRTALARALIVPPKLLLLDEPFSALDAMLKDKVRAECKALLSYYDIPIIIITHDPEDVLAFADAVIPYDNGTTLQALAMNTVVDKMKKMPEIEEPAKGKLFLEVMQQSYAA